MNVKEIVIGISLDVMREQLCSIEFFNTNDSNYKKRLKPSLDAKAKALERAILTLGHFGGTHKMTDQEQQDFFEFEDPYKKQ
jgi:hypothetical protein